MRIAITKGTLRVPPTYFALQHSELLRHEFEIRTFTMALELADEAVRTGPLEIVETAVLRGGSFRRREVLMPLALGAMARAVHRFAPAVVHQHFATWSSPAVRASVTTGAPLIVTVHGSDVFAALRPLSSTPLAARPMLAWHHRNARGALAGAARVLAVSRYLADRVVEAGAPADRVTVHYQGIDTEVFTPDFAARDVDAPPTVLFVGVLSETKGVRDLVAASLALIERAPHRLVFVGTGPLADELRAAAGEHPHIAVRGRLDRAGVRAELQAAHVTVLPTRVNDGAREAAGLVLLESQACATPVVAYRSGGTPEMLRDGQTGHLVDEGSIAALTEAIEAVLALSPAAHRAMGQAARDFVVAERSLAASAEQLAALYRELAPR